jgi:hypothetical protein
LSPPGYFRTSHEVVLINGTTVTVKVAHIRLCHSQMLFVRAYPRETQEMVFDAHDRAFAFFKGACTRGIYDNMKTAVETVFVGRERAYNTIAKLPLAKDLDDFCFDGTLVNETLCRSAASPPGGSLRDRARPDQRQLPGASTQRCAGRRDWYWQVASRHRNSACLHSWRCQRSGIQCR